MPRPYALHQLAVNRPGGCGRCGRKEQVVDLGFDLQGFTAYLCGICLADLTEQLGLTNAAEAAARENRLIATVKSLRDGGSLAPISVEAARAVIEGAIGHAIPKETPDVEEIPEPTAADPGDRGDDGDRADVPDPAGEGVPAQPAADAGGAEEFDIDAYIREAAGSAAAGEDGADAGDEGRARVPNRGRKRAG